MTELEERDVALEVQVGHLEDDGPARRALFRLEDAAHPATREDAADIEPVEGIARGELVARTTVRGS